MNWWRTKAVIPLRLAAPRFAVVDRAFDIDLQWLNQVEIWFSKIQRDVISRGIFTSTSDPSRKLIRYIKQYNKTATHFQWRFKNAAHRIKPVTQRASDSVH